MLKDQIAIVTGSTSGIGLGMARSLAQAGAAVVLNGLGDADEIEKTRAALEAETGSRIAYHPANMLKPAEIADMVAWTHTTFGRLDILVNNAGVQHVAPVGCDYRHQSVIRLPQHACRGAIDETGRAGTHYQSGLGPCAGGIAL